MTGDDYSLELYSLELELQELERQTRQAGDAGACALCGRERHRATCSVRLVEVRFEDLRHAMGRR